MPLLQTEYNATSFSPGFPAAPQPEVQRDQFLKTIEAYHGSGVKVVLIECDSGLGATTLLAQFVRKHLDRTVSIFLTPASKLAYDRAVIRSTLAAQISWLLDKKELKDGTVSEAVYRSLLLRLQRRSLRAGAFYFAIDGLADIPNEDEETREQILTELLPLGLSDFKFVITSHTRDFRKYLNLPVKSLSLTTFSRPEVAEYLGDLKLSSADLGEVERICKGIPAYLASVRRLLDAGRQLKLIMDEEPSALSDFLQIEWNRYVDNRPGFEDVLALVAYANRPLGIQELEQILKLSSGSLDESLNQCRILEVVSDATGRTGFQFISEAHRQFAGKKLASRKQDIINRLIDHAFEFGRQGDKVNLLPAYLDQAGRYDELLEFVSRDHLNSVLAGTSSLLAVKRDISLAFQTAARLQNVQQLFKFAVINSALSQVITSDPWVPELEAQIALGNIAAALALASSATTKENRLRLLARYARLMSERGTPIDEPLKQQIVTLVDDFHVEDLGEAAIDTATDLVVVAPETAMKVIERAAGKADGDEDLDNAFLRLAIVAADLDQTKQDTTAIALKARESIKDESLRKLTAGLSALLGKGGPQDAIRVAEKIEPKNRAAVLRFWVQRNRRNPEALAVVEFALDHMIRETELTITLRDLRRLAIPVAYSRNQAKVRELVKRIDGLKGTVKHLGSGEESVRLEMLLVRAEIRYDVEVAIRRFEATMSEVETLSDLSSKLDSLAWLFSTSSILSESHPERLGVLAEQIKRRLESTVEELLRGTAEQDKTFRAALQALARTNYIYARDIAARLNTESRRDIAYKFIVNALLESERVSSRLSDIQDCLERITDRLDSYALYGQVLDAIASAKEKLDESAVLAFIDHSFSIDDAYRRASALVSAMEILAKHASDKESLLRRLHEDFVRCIDIVDDASVAGELCFGAAAVLADRFRDEADTCLRLAGRISGQHSIRGDDLKRVYGAAIELCSRALASIAGKQSWTSEHLDRFQYLVDRLASQGTRARAWADFAMRCHLNGAKELARDMTARHVWPALAAINKMERIATYASLMFCAPCLYVASNAATYAALDQLPLEERDESYRNIISFLLLKLVPGDPYQAEPGERPKIGIQEVTECCDVLARVSQDRSFYFCLSRIVDALADRSARDWLNRQQRADVASRLEELIKVKLPDPKNITHDGYVLVSMAQIFRLRQAQPQEWDALVARMSSITNTADRVAVMAEIAIAMPGKLSLRRQELLRAAELLVPTMLSDVDRSQRYQWLGRICIREEPALSRRFLEAAFRSSLVLRDGQAASETRRETIELAHRLDPDFANMLSRSLDDDPARDAARRETQDKLKLLETKKRLAQVEKLDLRDSVSVEHLPAAAWLNLGALHSRRIGPVKLEQMQEYIRAAGTMSIRRSYPIFAWVIENAHVRYGQSPEVIRETCGALSEATLMCGSVLERVIGYFSDKEVRAADGAQPRSIESIVIAEGRRELARSTITDWIREKAGGQVKICDPYFCADSLWILKLLKHEKPSCTVKILMGRRHLSGSVDELEAQFRAAWRSISDVEPPDTDVVLAAVGDNGIAPIHERWLISEGAGLRIGTSLADLGGAKVSEISFLAEEDATVREQEIDQYLTFSKRSQGADKIRFSSFSL
jgi:hypothetical protein